MEIPRTIGVFAGLIGENGKLLLQRRIETDSIIGKSFQGKWELPGGRVEEKDVNKALILNVLTKELVRKVKEDLGVTIRAFPVTPFIYRTVYVNKEKGVNDWAFVIPIPYNCWSPDQMNMNREVIQVDPEELKELAEQNQVVSGWCKRMCRMSLAALFYGSFEVVYMVSSGLMLSEVMTDDEHKYGGTAPVILPKLLHELNR